jgi:hypothetical protein
VGHRGKSYDSTRWPMFLAWHIVWFARIALSLVLFLVMIRGHLYKQFPLFAVHSGWIAFAGLAVMVLNYARFVSGNQHFTVVTISNGVEAVLAFAIIYQIFVQRLHLYPSVRNLGRNAFRASTLVLLAAVLALAWLVPGPGAKYWTSFSAVIQRSARTLQCGQLVFLFLFCNYFRLSWRSRTFGIALGLAIVTSSSLAINAIVSQLGPDGFHRIQNIVWLTGESTNLVAVSVWLSYMLAPEQAPRPSVGPLPPDDLENWNRELGGMLGS